MAKLTTGTRDPRGTRRYTERFKDGWPMAFSRADPGPLSRRWVLGTLPRPEDGATDVLYQDAVLRSLELG